MNPSSGASIVSPLVVQSVSYDHATRITIRGRADSSNRDRLRRALWAVDVAATGRVELALARFEFCEVDAAFEPLAFAGEINDNDGDVVVVDATPWFVAMLTLLDVEGVVAIPAPRADSPKRTRLTTDVPPGQATALLQLMRALDHDGVAGPSGPVQASDGRRRHQTPPRRR